jgi:hypothetical protein
MSRGLEAREGRRCLAAEHWPRTRTAGPPSRGKSAKPRDYPEACRPKPPYATAAASSGKRAKDAILA